METATPARSGLSWLALVLHAVAGFLCFALGLSIPIYVWGPLMAAWLVLLVVLFKMWRRPKMAFIAPLVALALWFLVGFVLAETFNWTA